MRTYAIVCPGQGSQSPDMFDLAVADPRGRELLDACSAAVGFDLVVRARSGDDLFANAFAQPALVAAALATWAVLVPRVPVPALFAGYSVGELSAWCCAGAWDAADAVRVAAARARLMDAHAPPGCGMLAVRGLRRSDVASAAPGLAVAIVNDADHLVLAGDAASLAAAAVRLEALGATTRTLDVRVPAHTALLAAAATAFATFIASRPPRDAIAPVLRGIDGQRCTRGVDGADALTRAIAHTIRWDRCQEQLVESHVGIVLELGPGHALARMAAEAAPDLAARSVSDFRSIDGVVQWLTRQRAD